MFCLGVGPALDGEAAEEGEGPVEAEGKEEVGEEEEACGADVVVFFVKYEAEDELLVIMERIQKRVGMVKKLIWGGGGLL